MSANFVELKAAHRYPRKARPRRKKKKKNVPKKPIKGPKEGSKEKGADKAGSNAVKTVDAAQRLLIGLKP